CVCRFGVGEDHQAVPARRSADLQVTGKAVRDGLVEGAVAPIRPDVQLQRLQLDAQGIGNVLEMQRGEVRLACLRTETGELGDRQDRKSTRLHSSHVKSSYPVLCL